MMQPNYLTEVSAFVAELCKAQRAANFYPLTHPTLLRAVERTHMRLEATFYDRQELALTVTKENLLLDDKPLQVPGHLMKDLAFSIFRRRIKVLQFGAEATEVELLHFLELLAEDPRTIGPDGPEKALARKGIMSIWCNETKFSRAEIEEVYAEEGEEEQVEEEGPNPLELLLQMVDEPDERDVLKQVWETSDAALFQKLVRQVVSEHKPHYPKKGPAVYHGLMLALLHQSHSENPQIVAFAQKAIQGLVNKDMVHFLLRQMEQAVGSSWDRYRDLLVMVGTNTIPFIVLELVQTRSKKNLLRIRETLQQFGDSNAEYVFPLLGDTRVDVVRRALGVLSGKATEEQLPKIAPLLGHADANVRKEAAQVVRRIGTKAAFEALHAQLKKASADDQVVLLSEIGAFDEDMSEPVLIQYLRKGKLAQKEVAARGLALSGSERALAVLTDAFVDRGGLFKGEQWHQFRAKIGEFLLPLLPASMPLFNFVRKEKHPAMQTLVAKADAIMQKNAWQSEA